MAKYVELKYQVIDVKTSSVLTEVEFPLGYVHGVNEVLAPSVMQALEGKTLVKPSRSPSIATRSTVPGTKLWSSSRMSNMCQRNTGRSALLF